MAYGYSFAQRRPYSFGLPALPSFGQPPATPGYAPPLPQALELPELTPAETGEPGELRLPRLAARFPRIAEGARRVGDLVGNFGERFPRAAGVIDRNRDAMLQTGLAMLLTRSGNTLGNDVQNALVSGRQSDRERAAQEREDAERAAAEEAQRRSSELFRSLLGGPGGLPALPEGSPPAGPTVEQQRADGSWMRAGAAPDQIVQQRRDAIASIESGGEADPYQTVGPVANEAGNRAYGRYQVMDFNVGPWTEAILGQAMTPEQFLASPEAQDRVFDAKFAEYVQQFGSEEAAARAWFGGPGRASSGGSATDVNGMSVDRYGQRYTAAAGGAPAAAPAATGGGGYAALGLTDQQAGLLDMMLGDPNLAPMAQAFILERALAPPAGPEWENATVNGVVGQRNRVTGQFTPFPEYAQQGAAEPGWEWLTGTQIVELNQQGVALDSNRAYLRNLETGDVKPVGGEATGLAVDIDPDTGAVTIRQGAGAGALPTGLGTSASLNATYSGRMAQADTIIAEVGDAGTSWGQRFLAAITPDLFGRMLNSPEYQQYEQAERNFINAVLRRESGAVINPDEFANARQQYMPQPGDGPEVLEQKRQNREFATLLMAAGVTPGFDPYEAYRAYQATQGAPAAAAPIRIANDAEFDALPAGAHFIGPDGIERVKP